MQFDYTPKVKEMQARLLTFFDEDIYPNARRYLNDMRSNRKNGNAWIPTRVMEELKPLAREAGL